MPVDLALSEHNDLIFSGNHDAQLVGGAALVEQRIRLRLKIALGSWVLNPTLGSRLHELAGSDPMEAEAHIEATVQQALAAMTDISIQSITIEEEAVGVRKITVCYSPRIAEGEITFNDQLSYVNMIL